MVHATSTSGLKAEPKPPRKVSNNALPTTSLAGRARGRALSRKTRARLVSDRGEARQETRSGRRRASGGIMPPLLTIASAASPNTTSQRRRTQCFFFVKAISAERTTSMPRAFRRGNPTSWPPPTHRAIASPAGPRWHAPQCADPYVDGTHARAARHHVWQPGHYRTRATTLNGNDHGPSAETNHVLNLSWMSATQVPSR